MWENSLSPSMAAWSRTAGSRTRRDTTAPQWSSKIWDRPPRTTPIGVSTIGSVIVAWPGARARPEHLGGWFQYDSPVAAWLEAFVPAWLEGRLAVPTRPWEVGLVAFEIARRQRFHEEMSSLPDNVRVHVLPTGGDRLPPGLAQFRYRDRARVGQSIERAYTASASYLAELAKN